MDRSGRKEKDREKETLREKFKKEPFLIVTYFLLRMIVIVVMVLQARNGNYMNVFLCLLTLLLFTVPSFIEHRLKIGIPNTLENIVLIFIFSAEILGEIRSYYNTIQGMGHCTAYRYWGSLLLPSAFLLWLCLTGVQAV